MLWRSPLRQFAALVRQLPRLECVGRGE
jgi:hypothetical protein